MQTAHDPKAQLERLRIEGEQIRANAIRSRIETAQTFCAIAETEVSMAPERARHTLAKVRRFINELEHHILETDHLSHASSNELIKLLSTLKAGADLIEQSL